MTKGEAVSGSVAMALFMDALDKVRKFPCTATDVDTNDARSSLFLAAKFLNSGGGSVLDITTATAVALGLPAEVYSDNFYRVYVTPIRRLLLARAAAARRARGATEEAEAEELEEQEAEEEARAEAAVIAEAIVGGDDTTAAADALGKALTTTSSGNASTYRLASGATVVQGPQNHYANRGATLNDVAAIETQMIFGLVKGDVPQPRVVAPGGSNAGRKPLPVHALGPASPLFGEYHMRALEHHKAPQVVGWRPHPSGPRPAPGAPELRGWLRRARAWGECVLSLFRPFNGADAASLGAKMQYEDALDFMEELERRAARGDIISMGRLYLIDGLQLPAREASEEGRLLSLSWRSRAKTMWGKIGDDRPPPSRSRALASAAKSNDNAATAMLADSLARANAAVSDPNGRAAVKERERALEVREGLHARMAAFTSTTRGMPTGSLQLPPPAAAALAALRGAAAAPPLGARPSPLHPGFGTPRARISALRAVLNSLSALHADPNARCTLSFRGVPLRATASGIDPRLVVGVPAAPLSVGTSAAALVAREAALARQGAARGALDALRASPAAVAARASVAAGGAVPPGLTAIALLTDPQLAATAATVAYAEQVWVQRASGGDLSSLGEAPITILVAGPGSGKTFTMSAMGTVVAATANARVVSVSHSGAAASQVKGATLASVFFTYKANGGQSGTGEFTDDEQSILRDLFDSSHGAVILHIDEVSMSSPNDVAAVLRRLRALRAADARFSSVPVVLTGDFLQLPPVMAKSTASVAMRSAVAALLDAPDATLADSDFHLLHAWQRQRINTEGGPITLLEREGAAKVTGASSFVLAASIRGRQCPVISALATARSPEPLVTPPLLAAILERRLGVGGPGGRSDADFIRAETITSNTYTAGALNLARAEELARLLGVPLVTWDKVLQGVARGSVSDATIRATNDAQLLGFYFPGMPVRELENTCTIMSLVNGARHPSALSIQFPEGFDEAECALQRGRARGARPRLHAARRHDGPRAGPPRGRGRLFARRPRRRWRRARGHGYPLFRRDQSRQTLGAWRRRKKAGRVRVHPQR
jgi:hypothetical protein